MELDRNMDSVMELDGDMAVGRSCHKRDVGKSVCWLGLAGLEPWIQGLGKLSSRHTHDQVPGLWITAKLILKTAHSRPFSKLQLYYFPNRAAD